jgi:hypothetical protein
MNHNGSYTKACPTFYFVKTSHRKCWAAESPPHHHEYKKLLYKKRGNPSTPVKKLRNEIRKRGGPVSPPMTWVIFGSGFRGSWPLGLWRDSRASSKFDAVVYWPDTGPVVCSKKELSKQDAPIPIEVWRALRELLSIEEILRTQTANPMARVESFPGRVCDFSMRGTSLQGTEGQDRPLVSDKESSEGKKSKKELRSRRAFMREVR